MNINDIEEGDLKPNDDKMYSLIISAQFKYIIFDKKILNSDKKLVIIIYFIKNFIIFHSIFLIISLLFLV